MENDDVITPGEAAKMLGVDPKTLTRWANKNMIPSFRLPGGHRRYKLKDIEAIRNAAA
jgi:excisionase family DNA binding protein